MNRGGKIVTPLREAMSIEDCDGVVFRCEDPKKAEKVRVPVIIAKQRCNFDIRTHRNGNELIAYKNGNDYYEDLNYIYVDLAAKTAD